MPPGGGEKPASLFYKRRIMKKGGEFLSLGHYLCGECGKSE
jgi:hypothetical protein